MGAQTPAAGSNSTSFRSADSLCSITMEVDTQLPIKSSGPNRSWDVDVGAVAHEKDPRESQQYLNAQSRPASARRAHTPESQIHDWLANHLVDSELGDAFLDAVEAPPVTKQSLSELDIQNIITNIKLRHDVNFDRDLSFRPNVDGPKGQQKQRQSQQYSMALVAELQLYGILFPATESLWQSCPSDRAIVLRHMQRRIPKMFQTIHDILKSLVPERDHSRVDEHMDVPMLMQEIERGVCDLVSLAEWMACLLKEHCAPMRDVLVNEMVDTIKKGVAENSLQRIVGGMQKLFGILEAMKLDVANHQIRNLKTLLIEDTAKFENHYHLDRLVRGKARVNKDAAQKWWSSVSSDIRSNRANTAQSTPRFELEVFTRVVVATLFSRAGFPSFPETFYLDHDRLRALKTEIDDLIHLQICFTMFEQLLVDYGYTGQASSAVMRELRKNISAFIGENGQFSPHLWMHHAGPISLEICRQAAIVAGRSPSNLDLGYQQRAQKYLCEQFEKTFSVQAAALETAILPQILACTNKHFTSSSSDLFNNLVLPTPPPPHSFVPIVPVPLRDNTTAPHAEKLADLTNRITHIALLHWRIWAPIAYVLDDTPTSTQVCQPIALSTLTATPQGMVHHPSSQSIADSNAQAVDVGAPPDPGETGGTAAL